MRTVDLRTAEPGYACSRVMCIAFTHEPFASIEIYRMGWSGVRKMREKTLTLPAAEMGIIMCSKKTRVIPENVEKYRACGVSTGAAKPSAGRERGTPPRVGRPQNSFDACVRARPRVVSTVYQLLGFQTRALISFVVV